MKQEYLIENENAWDNAIYVLEGHFVSNKEEYEKFANIEIVKANTDDMLERMYSYTLRLSHAEFRKQMKDIVLVGLKSTAMQRIVNLFYMKNILGEM